MCEKIKDKDMDNQSNKESKINWEKVCAFVMIGLCALGLIAPFLINAYNHKTEDIKIQVCCVDSLQKDKALSAADAATVFRKMEQKELELEEKYNYVLQQKGFEFSWQSYVSYVIGLIVAICGFFGYKSIQDLKDDVTKNISDSAKKETQRFLDEKLNTLVQKKVEERMDNIYNPQSINVITKKLEPELIKYFDSYFTDISVGLRNPPQDSDDKDGDSKSKQMQDLECDEDQNSNMFNNQ